MFWLPFPLSWHKSIPLCFSGITAKQLKIRPVLHASGHALWLYAESFVQPRKFQGHVEHGHEASPIAQVLKKREHVSVYRKIS